MGGFTVERTPSDQGFSQNHVRSFSRLNLTFSKIKVNFSKIKVDFSKIKLNFSKIKVDFSKIKVDFSKIKVDFSKIKVDKYNNYVGRHVYMYASVKDNNYGNNHLHGIMV